MVNPTICHKGNGGFQPNKPPKTTKKTFMRTKKIGLYKKITEKKKHKKIFLKKWKTLPVFFSFKLNRHVLPVTAGFRFSTERLWHRRASREHGRGGHRTLRQAQRGILRGGVDPHGGASAEAPLGVIRTSGKANG